MDEIDGVWYKPMKKHDHDQLLATKPYKPGDMIYASYPYALSSLSQEPYPACAYCFKRTKLLRCSKCQKTKYCSRECQKKDWLNHKIVCCKTIDPIGMLCLKIVEMLVANEEPCAPCDAVDSYRKEFDSNTFLELQEYTQRDPFGDNLDFFRQCITPEFLHLLPSTETVSIAFRDSILSRCDAPLRNRDYPPQLIAQYNDIFEEQFCGRFDMRNEDRYILRLLQKLRVNCVPVRDEHLAIMGYGVYPTLSPLIHSCQPNCAVTFAGIRANVIALRPIKKGETLTISLFPTCHNALVRDRWLMRLGCGVCHCPRCTWETDSIRKEEIAMFSLKCTKQIKEISCNGECVPEMPFPGGFPLSYRCKKCNATFSVMERFHTYPLADLDPAYDGFSCYFGKSVTESRFDVMKLKASINALSMHVADSNSELLSQRITLLRYYLFSENYQAAVELGEFLLPVVVEKYGRGLEMMTFYWMMETMYEGVHKMSAAKEFGDRYRELARFFQIPV
ncbi:hypothetical protein WA588_003164 [Blastocystis sp. NMH]